jgi:hypothetical protein
MVDDYCNVLASFFGFLYEWFGSTYSGGNASVVWNEFESLY